MKRLFGEVSISKKAIAAVAGCTVVFILNLVGYEDTEAINQIVALVSAYILGQGVADFGKSAKQIKD